MAIFVSGSAALTAAWCSTAVAPHCIKYEQEAGGQMKHQAVLGLNINCENDVFLLLTFK